MCNDDIVLCLKRNKDQMNRHTSDEKREMVWYNKHESVKVRVGSICHYFVMALEIRMRLIIFLILSIDKTIFKDLSRKALMMLSHMFVLIQSGLSIHGHSFNVGYYGFL